MCFAQFIVLCITILDLVFNLKSPFRIGCRKYNGGSECILVFLKTYLTILFNNILWLLDFFGWTIEVEQDGLVDRQIFFEQCPLYLMKVSIQFSIFKVWTFSGTKNIIDLGSKFLFCIDYIQCKLLLLTH